MGTIFRLNKIRVRIIPGDHAPAHVHVEGPGCEAKVEIATAICYFSRGFSGKDIAMIEEFIEERKDRLLEAWNEINEE